MLKHTIKLFTILTLMLLCSSSFMCLADESTPAPLTGCQVSFGQGLWSPDQWLLVKCNRDSYIGSWIQNEDHIQNAVPKYTDPKQLISMDTYTSMLWKQPLTGNFIVSSTMVFEHDMAPMIVLADTLGSNADGYPEYRQHWEIIIWNEGVNVWHHRFADGKPNWHLAASVKYPLTPKVKYELKVAVRHQQAGTELTIICDKIKFTYIEHDFPATVQAGITGCEGINRFYDFKISPL